MSYSREDLCPVYVVEQEGGTVFPLHCSRGERNCSACGWFPDTAAVRRARIEAGGMQRDVRGRARLALKGGR